MIRSLSSARLAALASATGTCCLLTACGSSPAPGPAATATVTVQPGPGGGSATSAAAASAPSPSAATAGTPGCLASGLRARLGVSQGTAGTIYQVVVLTSTSAASCTLYGYPGVSFVTGPGGHQVGAPATKSAVPQKTRVTLAPGGQASVLLAVHDAGAFPDCAITNVGWLRIYPPGDYGSVYLRYKTQTCANARKPTMSVTAVRAGAGSAAG